MSGDALSGNAGVAQAALWGFIRGWWRFPALLCFTQLGCAGILDAGPATTRSLAACCDAEEGMLGRLLRWCASAGIVTAIPGGRWELTGNGRELTGNGSMRAAVLACGTQPATLAMLDLARAVRSGRPVFTDHAGTPDLYAWHRDSPGEREVFQEFMTARSAPAARIAAGWTTRTRGRSPTSAADGARSSPPSWPPTRT